MAERAARPVTGHYSAVILSAGKHYMVFRLPGGVIPSGTDTIYPVRITNTVVLADNVSF